VYCQALTSEVKVEPAEKDPFTAPWQRRFTPCRVHLRVALTEPDACETEMTACWRTRRTLLLPCNATRASLAVAHRPEW